MIDLKDDGTHFISFYLKVGKQQLLVPIEENMSMDSHPFGFIFYMHDGRVRKGTLQKDRNFKMLEGNLEWHNKEIIPQGMLVLNVRNKFVANPLVQEVLENKDFLSFIHIKSLNIFL